MAFFAETREKSDKLGEKEITSKSGLCYRVKFDTRKRECTVTCLSGKGICNFYKREIRRALDPMKMAVVETGIDSVTYKCPPKKRKEVIKRIEEC